MDNITIEELNRIRKSSVEGRTLPAKPETGFTQRAEYARHAFVTGTPVCFGRAKSECNERIESNGCSPEEWIWITDGKTSTQHYVSEPMPAGFRPGRLKPWPN